jgi:succinate dehydrogenase / fumarate reductase membrane anchor subunit
MLAMVLSVDLAFRQGVRDWLIQRSSALLMLVYLVYVVSYFMLHPLTYVTWHDFFAQNHVKALSLLFILALCLHAWVGVWTIFSDYIHSFCLRVFFLLLAMTALLACFFYGLMILLGV